jgi:hypothetical protein
MNHCILCHQKTVFYAFKNKKNSRYLRCASCNFIFKEIQRGYSKKSVQNNVLNNLTKFENLKIYLKRVKVNNKINFKQIITDIDVLNDKEYNFYLTKKSIYVLLQRFNFKNIVITINDNHQIKIEATKRPNQPFKICFIVPVFNEAENCEATISKLINMKFKQLLKEIVIVESNSNDGTKEIIEKFIGLKDVKVVFQSKALGKGNAVREGILRSDSDFIAIQDADGEYDLEDYYNLIPPILTGEETFVLGNRHSENWWKMRRFKGQAFKALILNFGQVLFTFLINKVTGAKLKDPFTMFKVFRRDILLKVILVSDRFDLDHEIVIKFLNAGHEPREIPVNYNSRSFNEGKKIRFFSDPINWLIAIIKYGVLKK